MTFETHLGPREHRLVVAGLLLAGLVLICAPNAVLGVDYQCLLQRITGLRCPFCGMTRDFILMAHGSLPRNNPGSLLAALGLYVAYPIWLAVGTLRGGSHLLVRRSSVNRTLLVTMVLLFVCNNLFS